MRFYGHPERDPASTLSTAAAARSFRSHHSEINLRSAAMFSAIGNRHTKLVDDLFDQVVSGSRSIR
jgi:hypothetical protein